MHSDTKTKVQMVVGPDYSIGIIGKYLGPTTLKGPTAWNSLPDYLRDPSLSEDTFRRLLKTYLFAMY